MKVLRTLHLASFNGNIGDNANHYGFYKYLKKSKSFNFQIDELEIREFYWKKRFFDKSFVDLVNTYDLLIIGGGNYFELWVETSPTGTSIAIEPELYKKINIPVIFNALGVDSGQGVSELSREKFRKFLDVIIEQGSFISVRNDGAMKTTNKYIGKKYLESIFSTPDAGFFIDTDCPSKYYKDKKYIAVNIATDMSEERFPNVEGKVNYHGFVSEFKKYFNLIFSEFDLEFVFVPHIYSDLVFINDMLQIMNDEDRRIRVSVAPLLHGKHSFREVMSIYSNAELVLANRFHANVCSIGLGVPTIGLMNYRQIDELYKEIDSTSIVDIRNENFSSDLLRLSKIMLNAKPEENSHIIVRLQAEYEIFINSLFSWLESK
jgi:polysaccharide pyruvyl transferase WcaK-like protein